MIKFILIVILNFFISISQAGECLNDAIDCEKIKEYNVCCGQMNGVSYCDSSSGRLVCNNGYVSSCYCTKRAVMDIKLLEGCCIWRGGVLQIIDNGIVLCHDGSVSLQCSEGH